MPYQTSEAAAQSIGKAPLQTTAEPRSFVHGSITARQLQVLSWVQEGKSSGDIAAILGLSTRTVEHHIEKICRRLGVRTRLQATLKARDMQLITPLEGKGYPSSKGRHTSF